MFGVLSAQQTKKGRKQMEKEMLVKEIERMLKKCNDAEMIHLIYILLLKADKKLFTAESCSGESSPID